MPYIDTPLNPVVGVSQSTSIFRPPPYTHQQSLRAPPLSHQQSLCALPLSLARIFMPAPPLIFNNLYARARLCPAGILFCSRPAPPRPAAPDLWGEGSAARIIRRISELRPVGCAGCIVKSCLSHGRVIRVTIVSQFNWSNSSCNLTARDICNVTANMFAVFLVATTAAACTPHVAQQRVRRRADHLRPDGAPREIWRRRRRRRPAAAVDARGRRAAKIAAEVRMAAGAARRRRDGEARGVGDVRQGGGRETRAQAGAAVIGIAQCSLHREF